MDTAKKANSYYLTKKMFWRIFPIQVLMCSVGAVNAIIDGLIGSRFIGAEAMAAVGLFAPVDYSFDFIIFILSVGGIMLIAKSLGKGEKAAANDIFSLVCTMLAAIGIVLTVLLLVFSGQLASLLKGNDLLEQYIKGYAILLMARLLSEILMDAQQILGNSRLPLFSIIVMAIVNIAFDLIFVCWFDLGIFGIGLATGLGYLAQLLTVIMPFFKKNCPLRFSYKNLKLSFMPQILRYGLPGALGQLTISVKTLVENNLLLSLSGTMAVAAAAVNSTLSWLMASVAVGACQTSTIMMSLFIGEEDSTSMKNTLSVIMRNSILIALLLTVGVTALADPISALYYSKEPDVMSLTATMCRLFPSFILFTVPLYTLTGLYQAQGKKVISYIFNSCENLFIAVFIALLGKIFGINGIWLGLPVGAFALLLALFSVIWIRNRRITFAPHDLLLLSEDFGVPECDRIDCTIYSMEEAVGLSNDICEFCTRHGLSQRETNAAGLSAEEISILMFRYSLKDVKNAQADVRVFIKNDKLTLRIRDNGTPLFTDNKISIEDPDDPAANIGIRLLLNMADDVSANSIMGMNVITITV